MDISVLLDASFASLSASSLPVVPTCAFVHQNLVVHTLLPVSCTFRLLISVRNVCLLKFCSHSTVVLLPLDTVVTLSTSFSQVVFTYSSALSVSNAYAWLLVRLVSILYISSTVVFLGLIMAIPAPTPCSDLLASV